MTFEFTLSATPSFLTWMVFIAFGFLFLFSALKALESVDTDKMDKYGKALILLFIGGGICVYAWIIALLFRIVMEFSNNSSIFFR